MAHSAFTLRRNCCRWRTVSPTWSSSSASEPPTWRWMFTLITTNSKSIEPRRSAMACIASSFGRPRRTSFATRPNSRLVGSEPSRIDRLHRLVPGVAGLQRGRHGDQRVGQLLAEGLLALARLQLQPQHGQEEAEREQASSTSSGKTPAKPAAHAEQQGGAELHVEHLAGAQRQVGALDQSPPCSSRTGGRPAPSPSSARGARASADALVRRRRPRGCASRTPCSPRAAASACGAGAAAKTTAKPTRIRPNTMPRERERRPARAR